MVSSWDMLLDASVYILFGIAVGGLLKMFLSTAYVVRHLGGGRFSSVAKAALLGIPIPLCSCGVLPAAASLKKQGANNGATTAFLISTPESGVDSISITYALLDPIMTVARPLAAFLSAMVAGVAENLVNPPVPRPLAAVDNTCVVDGCCDGVGCPPDEHRRHHTFMEKVRAGMRYAVGDLWGDLAPWFFVGIILAGLITTLIPNDVIEAWLGGGLSSMVLMLVIGIPLYICATASTPIAAAFIMKGVSPGTALVFLLVGPATNVTSMSVLVGLLGKRAVGLYLAAIAVVSVLCGLAVDALYGALGVAATAVVGQAAEIIPLPARLAATFFLIAVSVKPLWASLRAVAARLVGKRASAGCGCGGCVEHEDEGHLHVLPMHGGDHDHGSCGCGGGSAPGPVSLPK